VPARAVREQQPDQQGGATSVDADRPQHILRQGQDVADQFRQDRLIVEDPARQ
jgi:hypothetical protein